MCSGGKRIHIVENLGTNRWMYLPIHCSQLCLLKNQNKILQPARSSAQQSTTEQNFIKCQNFFHILHFDTYLKLRTKKKTKKDGS